MPELPEVETIRRGLEKYLVGISITDIEVRLSKMFEGKKEDIIDQKIVGVRRFGKGLVIDFKNKKSLVAHVKMTGQFIYKGVQSVQNFHPQIGIANELPNKWTHIIFSLGNGDVLYYNDIRQFGWLKVCATDDVHSLTFFKNLGPEPFRDLTVEVFRNILQESKRPIKTLLMDQSKISGVGNIYANEALFKAGVHPASLSSEITNKKVKKLHDSLLEVLIQGLELGGASDVNYLNVDGKTGGFQHHFKVYRRDGKECFHCQSLIKRIVIGGRGTFYCPRCQKEKAAVVKKKK